MHSISPIFRITAHENVFTVEIFDIGAEVSRIKSKFVIDLDPFQEIIGIEILDLKMHAGENCLEMMQKFMTNEMSSGKKFSYDAQVDAFYLKILKERRSVGQKAVEGDIVLNDSGNIIALVAYLAD